MQEDTLSTGPPFALSQLEQATIMTLLSESIDTGNANWLRDKIITYAHDYQPPFLVLNLVNIWQIDRLGVGALITLKARLPKTTKFALMAVQEPVSSQLQAMYLRHTFQIFWPGQNPCLLCGQSECAHTAQWQIIQAEYQWQGALGYDSQDWNPHVQEFPTSQPDWFQIYAQDPRYQALEAERRDKEFWQKLRSFLFIGAFSSLFVWGAFSLVLIAMNTDWSKGFESAKPKLKRFDPQERKYNKPKILTPEEILDHYDRDGDGLFTKEDWKLLNTQERLTLINHGFQEKQLNNRSLFEQFK
jgi:anti-anti-sigma regulatory factor